MRALLKTYSTKLEAEVIVEQLAEAGIAAVAMIATDPAPYHANAMTAVWIEDASLLDDVNTRQILEDILADYQMRPEDEDAIASMATDEPETSAFQNRYVVIVALAIAAVVLVLGAALNSRTLAE